MKHIVLTGGGTAGHVTPNIALIPKLKEAGYKISYIGSYDGMERKLIEDLGIPYYGISSGKPCGEKHAAESNSDFKYGYMYRLDGFGLFSKEDRNDCTDVVIWRGKYNNNIHCTTNLDINSWTTAKS